MLGSLPPAPATPPDIQDRFSDGPDPDLWIDGYLPHWTTPERARARYSRRSDGLMLRIDEDQPDWRPEDAPLRVSNLQTGSFSGPLGSTRGTHRHRLDGLRVETETPLRLLWAPSAGRVDIEVSASRDLDCMLAAWLVGTEHRSARECGEVCIFEIDARQAGDHWTARTGIKAHHDERLTTRMTEIDLPFDAGAPHVWTAIWGEGETTIGCNGEIVQRIPQAPDYPMFLMVDLFEIGSPRGVYPKTALVHSARGWDRAGLTRG